MTINFHSYKHQIHHLNCESPQYQHRMKPSFVTSLLGYLIHSYQCRYIFNSLHSLSHHSIRATQCLITAQYVWPNINSDPQSCTVCQQSKVQRHNKAPPGTFVLPDACFNQIHIDIVDPLPPSHGFTYLLICIDGFTRWPEAIPVTNITAETIACAFIQGWMSRFGVPSTVTTNRVH